MRRAWPILCLFGATGCPTIGAYQCERDEDCNRAGADGRCLPDAACAYPEESGRCESGWARSPNAADSPGACIDAEPPATSSGSSTSGPAESSGATTDPSDTLDPSISESGIATDGLPCGETEVELDTSTFSPGAGLDGFPLWLSLTGWDGSDRITSGDDLRIMTADGTTLAYEREDGLDGAPGVWIDLPAFEAEETLQLRFIVGPDLGTPDPADLWSQRYVGVWHMNDVPTGLDGDLVRNSVRDGDDGAMLGSIQPEQRIEGVVGPALEFDGIDDIVEIAASFQGQLDAYTISMWVRVDSPPGDTRGSPFQRLNGDFFYPRCWHASDGSLGFACQHQVGGDTTFIGSTSPLPKATMVHFAMVRDPSIDQTTLYVGGEQNNTASDLPGGVLDTDPEPRAFELGHGEWGTLLGAIDEVRVSASVLTPERLRADYRSQTGTLQLVEFGTLSPAACPQ